MEPVYGSSSIQQIQLLLWNAGQQEYEIICRLSVLPMQQGNLLFLVVSNDLFFSTNVHHETKRHWYNMMCNEFRPQIPGSCCPYKESVVVCQSCKQDQAIIYIYTNYLYCPYILVCINICGSLPTITNIIQFEEFMISLYNIMH